MTQMELLAGNIPADYRRKILFDWLPTATPALDKPEMLNLFNAWFLFIQPNGVQNRDCPICVNNVLQNWKAMQAALVALEKQDNLLLAI